MATGDSTLPTREIRVHVDTLEWTRRGLRTRASIDLKTGFHNRIMLVNPQRVGPVPISAGGFPEGTSFPGPAVLALCLFAPWEIDSAVLQVFAHGDPSGSDDANKRLTDRRARVTEALLLGDVEPVLAAAADEGWGLDLQQVMLRALDCDPGPVDGIAEELTRNGVAAFQQRYTDGGLPRAAGSPERLIGALPNDGSLDGSLDTDTAKALIDAYVAAFSVRVHASQMHPSHPANGCLGHNPMDGASTVGQRRVSLLLHEAVPEFHSNQPCVAGDEPACIVMHDEGHRCDWYRRHVKESAYADVEHHHFQAGWLKLANGHYLLSALTTVPDDEEVEFTVFAAPNPVDGPSLGPSEALGEPLGETIRNAPRSGVAQVVWVPPAAFAPGPDGRLARGGESVVPVFRVTHQRSGSVLYDSWPGVGSLLIATDVPADVAAMVGLRYRIFSANGAYDETQTTDEAEVIDGFSHLFFGGLPRASSFSLEVTELDGRTTEVFSSVPFSDLGGLSDVPETELLDPFGREELGPQEDS